MRAEGAVPIIGTIERVAEHGGGNPVQAVTLSGAWILSDRTSLDVLSKTKSAWAAIMEPTSVPWGSLRRLVAEVTGSSRTKFSPPTTEPERAPTTGELAVPVSMTATTTPWPVTPWLWSVAAPVSRLLKLKLVGWLETS